MQHGFYILIIFSYTIVQKLEEYIFSGLRALQLYEKELNGKIYPNFQQEDVNKDFF